MLVIGEQQISSQPGVHSIVQPVDDYTNVVHAESNAIDQHIRSHPCHGTTGLGGHSDLQTVRPRPQYAVHGTDAVRFPRSPPSMHNLRVLLCTRPV